MGVLCITPRAAQAAEPSSSDGYVIMIEDSFIYINLGRDRGSQVGDLFAVWRPGKAIVDPVTGDTLGSEPVTIAKLRVQYVSPHYSKTYALEVVGKIPVQVRDRVSRWSGEKTGLVPAPAVLDIEVAAPVRGESVFKGDKIFKDRRQNAGDVVGEFEIEGEVLDYDFGDIDGDGVADLVTLEPRRVTVYSVASGVPEKQWSETIKGFLYVALEVFDSDGDGASEMFVGQKLGNVGRTDIYRYKDGHYVKAGEIKGFFVRGSGASLYAQKYGFAKPFGGQIVEVKYDPGTNSVSKLRDVFDGPANVLGLGVGKDRMAYLDFNDRLTITDRTGQPVWRGTTPLGGSTQELTSGNGRETEKLKKKITFDDFDGNNIEDVLVIKNELNPFWGVTGILGGSKYQNGKFVIYTDRPGGWDVLKETRDFEGYVSDYEYTVVGSREKQLSLCLVTSVGRDKWKSKILVLREL